MMGRDMSVTRRVRAFLVTTAVIAAVTACSDDPTVTTSPVAPVTTATIAPATTVTTTTATTTATATTITVPPATSTTAPLPEIVIEQLDPTPADGDGPVWIRSDDTYDRGRHYWLGAQGDGFVLLSWRWPAFDLAAQRSVDGIDWTSAAAVTGLPPSAEPWYWWHGLDSFSAVAASPAGLIAVFDVPTETGNDTRIKQVFTSGNGAEWVLEPLPAIEGLTSDGGPFAVAAGPSGFAVWATADERRPESSVLFVRHSDGDWLTVDLPAHGNAWENWVAPAEIDFLARAATGPSAHVGSHPVFRVDTAGNVGWDVVPSDSPPIEWNGDLLTTTPYNNVPQPTLYWGPEGSTWRRLPTPDFTTDDEEAFWGTDTYTAGRPGIVLAGCNCGDYWGFLGEAMVDIEVDKGGHHISVYGDQVTVDGIWDHPIRADTGAWFDESTGALAVPDPTTGETMVTVTCDEMRASAREKMREPELLSPPPQDLLFSPDGTSWFHQDVTSLFGTGSYVHQSAAFGETIVLFVDPTGDAPSPDPPGCPLGVYPDAKPFEAWVFAPSD